MQEFTLSLPMGATTKVILDGNFIRITRKGYANVVRHGFVGEKSLNINDISAVELKEAKTAFTGGYIRFLMRSGRDVRGQMDDNNILFSKSDNEKAQQIKNYVESIIAYGAQPATAAPVQPLSPAEEILKMKGLLDAGILTQEEFETKKKQLLGL